MSHTSWRIYITASQAGGNNAIGEIEMRATFGGADQCAGGTAIKSVEQFGLLATAAFDNNTATAWASNNFTTAWIGYTFASAVDVLEVAITAWTDATFWSLAPKDFQIQYSDDGFATPGTIVYNTRGVVWTGPGQTQLFRVGAVALEATKSSSYAVLGPPLLLSCTKKVMYVITGPDSGVRQRIKVRYVKSHQ